MTKWQDLQDYALRKPVSNEQNDTVLAFGREQPKKWPGQKCSSSHSQG